MNQSWYESLPKRNLLIFVLLGVAALWAVYAGYGIWSYAAVETEPPVFDALSYAQKAQSFWASVAKGEFFNPLSLEPTIRPFGTVLVSYPFGYSEDFRGFYFRTMFIPLVVILFAFLLVSPFKKLSSRQLIMIVVIAIAASSIPSNFQFQLNEGKSTVLGTWGFVDTFFAAILAFATSLILRGTECHPIRCAGPVAALAAFSLLIKPAGLMMIGVIGLVWAVFNFPRQPICSENVKRFAGGLAVFAVVCGITVLVLANSQYISLKHAQYGIRGLELLKAQYESSPTLMEVAGKLHLAIGWGLSSYLVFGLLVSLGAQWRRHLIAALLVLASGYWLWIGRTSINNVRYFLPFLVMALVIVTPPILGAVEKMHRGLLVLVGMVLLMPTLLIAYLLAQPAPSKNLQRIAGVNLSANIHPEGVMHANALLAEMIAEPARTNIIYYCGVQPKVRAFQAVFDWDRIVNGSKGHTIPALPIDWVREHAYRLDELRRARFVIFEKPWKYEKVLAQTSIIDTFDQEQLVIRAWLNSLNDVDGVRIRFDGDVRVLEIIDIDAFDQAALKLYKRYKWRKAFVDGYRHKWLSDEELGRVGKGLLEEVVPLRHQGDLMAELMEIEVVRKGNEVVASIYVKHNKPIREIGSSEPWYVFIQLLDEQGKVEATVNEVLATGRPLLSGVRRYDLKLSAAFFSKKRKAAVGTFSPQADGHMYLLSRDGDWGGRRNIFVIPDLKAEGL